MSGDAAVLPVRHTLPGPAQPATGFIVIGAHRGDEGLLVGARASLFAVGVA